MEAIEDVPFQLNGGREHFEALESWGHAKDKLNISSKNTAAIANSTLAAIRNLNFNPLASTSLV